MWVNHSRYLGGGVCYFSSSPDAKGTIQMKTAACLVTVVGLVLVSQGCGKPRLTDDEFMKFAARVFVANGFNTSAGYALAVAHGKVDSTGKALPILNEQEMTPEQFQKEFRSRVGGHDELLKKLVDEMNRLSPQPSPR